MLASFNPHSPAAKMVGFCSQMQLTHVTKYKLSRIIGDEGESHKAMGNPTLGCIGILCSTTDSTIITQTDLDCVCQNLSVSISARLLSCDMEHCRVCKGVWCQAL